jgi:hypothetical protein
MGASASRNMKVHQSSLASAGTCSSAEVLTIANWPTVLLQIISHCHTEKAKTKRLHDYEQVLSQDVDSVCNNSVWAIGALSQNKSILLFRLA